MANQELFEESSILCVGVHRWCGHKSVDYKKMGVPPDVLEADLCFKGGFLLISPKLVKKFRAKQEAVRSFAENRNIAHKFGEGTYRVANTAMAEFEKEFAKASAGFDAFLELFKVEYETMKQERLSRFSLMLHRIKDATPGLPDDFVSMMMGDLAEAYPAKEDLSKLFYVELEPHPLMAMFPQKKVMVPNFTDPHLKQLWEMGAEKRNLLIERAGYSEKALRLGHQIEWRTEILERMKPLKRACKKGKVKGQTINGLRLALTRHQISDYFHEEKLQTLMSELLDLLPDGTYVAYSEINKDKVYKKICEIGRKIKEEESGLKVEQQQYSAQARLVRVFKN